MIGSFPTISLRDIDFVLRKLQEDAEASIMKLRFSRCHSVSRALSWHYLAHILRYCPNYDDDDEEKEEVGLFPKDVKYFLIRRSCESTPESRTTVKYPVATHTKY